MYRVKKVLILGVLLRGKWGRVLGESELGTPLFELPKVALSWPKEKDGVATLKRVLLLPRSTLFL
jgi:hypothetical protein